MAGFPVSSEFHKPLSGVHIEIAQLRGSASTFDRLQRFAHEIQVNTCLISASL
jgi:hypothetical protein